VVGASGDGNGSAGGGHKAGTGRPGKTEFPASWTDQDILDAARQVTQQGPPVEGPFTTKNADDQFVKAWNYEGVVKGVRIQTTVLQGGEIRTAFPVRPASPGVIVNPKAPSPAPSGIPLGVSPRYSNPAAGGDGSWTWRGKKKGKDIEVRLDANGQVATVDHGPVR
jgi:hypothetical protein